ncbi:hypothetical protein BC833DRAFT_600713 [Globomyces pollinis-pini]|nr:hypothetical protein BC833DRAFT_600713 [Globomyces pollinis-pini]
MKLLTNHNITNILDIEKYQTEQLIDFNTIIDLTFTNIDTIKELHLHRIHSGHIKKLISVLERYNLTNIEKVLIQASQSLVSRDIERIKGFLKSLKSNIKEFHLIVIQLSSNMTNYLIKSQIQLKQLNRLILHGLKSNLKSCNLLAEYLKMIKTLNHLDLSRSKFYDFSLLIDALISNYQDRGITIQTRSSSNHLELVDTPKILESFVFNDSCLTSNEQLTCITKLIQYLPCINKIWLNGTNFNDHQISEIIKPLVSNPNIKSLKIGTYQIISFEKTSIQLSLLFKHNISINYISFKGIKFSNQELLNIFQYLGENTSIKSLEFENLDLSVPTKKLLVRQLSNNQTLTNIGRVVEER